MKILLVEDSHDISLALTRALFSDFNIDTVKDGQSAIIKTSYTEYDIIILDLNLPDISGYEVLRSLRQNNINIPVLILSADTKVITKIHLLDAGADDYLTKPFSLGELKVRLRTLYRRAESKNIKPNKWQYEDLELDSDTHTVIRAGHTIKLRRKEFSLLECLIQNSGRVVSRQTLTEYAWRDNDSPWANTVDVHIKYLRDKIDRPFETSLIKTVHGYGYKLGRSPTTIVFKERV